MSAFLLAIPRQAELVSLDRVATAMTAYSAPPDGGAPATVALATHSNSSLSAESAGGGPGSRLTAQCLGAACAWRTPEGDTVCVSGFPELVQRRGGAATVSEPITARHLAEAWSTRGIALLDALSGPYAVAVWSEREQLLRLQVDQLNIQALFLRVTDEAIYASTEVTPLLAAAGATRRDEAALRDIVSYRFLAGARSCWEGVRQVTYGRRLAVGLGGEVREEPAPRLHFGEADPSLTLDSASQQLDRALRGNLERLRDSGVSDVAVLVSGGIDSAVLAAMAQRTFPRCTAVTFEVDDYPNPELARAQEVAQRLKLPMHVSRVQDTDVRRLYPWIAGRVQEPPLHYNNPVIARMLEDVQGIAPVVISGDVAGHYGMGLHGALRRQAARQRWLAHVPQPGRRALASALRATGVRRLGRAANQMDKSGVELLHGLRAQLLHPEAAAALPSHVRTIGPTQDFVKHVFEPDADLELAGVMWSERVVEGAIYRRNTRLSAPLGIRYVYPLFDVAALDVLTAIPPALRFDSATGLNKPLLRALCDRYVGADVTAWSKLGLPSPEQEWMEGPLAPYLQESFADQSLLADFVDVRALRALPLARHQSTLWTLMTLHEVLRQGTDAMSA